MLVDILGILLCITGFFDAYKYHWESNAIRKVGTASGHSRKFINVALLNDVIRIVYLCLRFDLFIMIASLFAVVCMLEMWITIYNYYPYRMRKMMNFRKPAWHVYLINSMLPNKSWWIFRGRKRL